MYDLELFYEIIRHSRETVKVFTVEYMCYRTLFTRERRESRQGGRKEWLFIEVALMFT